MKKDWVRDVIEIITLVISTLTLMFLVYLYSTDPYKEELQEEAIEESPMFFSQSPNEGLREALEYYEIAHPEIVYAQAILETGHFKSDVCITHNNLFGLYNSRKKKYFKFNHWTESVQAYKSMIQYRYNPPGDYYKFLQRINYAEDPNYIKKLKQLVKSYETEQDASTSSNQQIGEGSDSPSQSSDKEGDGELYSLRKLQNIT